ncbi:MAG: ABC transporter ATP-binding protein [Candidatus Lokiarchaeota archaeon]|nr:ABC transporter ATP-binding protein [Candidatus Lokiarchaeota archaeon]
MKNAIELENLKKVYSGKKKVIALDSVSFKVPRKTAVGYLGPNGAGKSTTIKILTNTLKPTSGSTRIYGYDVQKETMRALESCGVILEVPEFYPYLTPRETMEYLGRLRGMRDKNYLAQRIKEVMEAVDMTDWVDIKIGTFSTGMRQRTAIAQAILHEPPLLILDEPTNGLDPKGMADVRGLIKDLKKEHTIFLSSHLLNEVEQICDSIILIHHGKILAFDSIQKIKQILKGDQIKLKLLNPADDLIIKKIENLNNVISVMKDNEFLLLNYDGSNESSSKILDNLIKDLNLHITSFTPIDKGLEAFYIEMIDHDNDMIKKGGKMSGNN